MAASWSISTLSLPRSATFKTWLLPLGAAAVGAAALLVMWKHASSLKLHATEGAVLPSGSSRKSPAQQAEWYAAAVRLLHTLQTPLPVMIVDLSAFDANAAAFARVARSHGKRIRIATKSLRVPALIERVLQRHADVFVGLMCYSAAEAAFWAARGQHDILIAYPTLQSCDVAAVFNAMNVNAGTLITMMVDCPTHVATLAAAWTAMAAAREAGSCPTLSLCIDADMSYRPVGGALHLGAHRSPCRTLADFIALYDTIAATPHARLTAVMGYEAQVAGVPDHSTLFMTTFKTLSMADVVRKRAAIANFLQSRGVQLAYFNGSGTGNAAHACEYDASITEVTVGSGLLQSHIFDGFGASTSTPAMCYALQVSRTSGTAREGRVVTCHSGGFISSGAVGMDKAPVAVYPRGLAPFPDEGFGEVQTPLQVLTAAMTSEETAELRPGGIVLLRPAKAGEIAEHFQQYLLLEPGTPGSGEEAGIIGSVALRVVDSVPTYRGMGLAFY